MQPTSRAFVLAALAALLASPILAGPAHAQGGQADLQLVSISAASPRYLVPTTVTVVVENRGAGAFDTTQGWQVFVGWNGISQEKCVTGGDGVYANQPCYQRVNPGLLNAPLGAGERHTFTFTWTPGEVAAGDQRGEGQLWGLIMPFGQTAAEAHRDNPPPIPGEASGNNVRSYPVKVQAPQVRAVPVRDAAPDAPDKNAFWRWDQITKDCLGPEQVTTFGCRAKPGNVTRFSYTVYNLGTASDSFTAEFLYGGPNEERELADKGYRFTLSSKTVTVPAGGSETVHLDILVPQNETHNQGINLNGTSDPSPSMRLRWYSRENAAVHTSNTAHCQNDELCVDPTLPSIYAGIRHAVNATSNETRKPVHSGVPITFNARVENAGNHVDSYNVTILMERSTINASWRPNVTVPASIPAHGAANVTIDLYPPEDAVKDVYRFDVRIRSLGDPTGQALGELSFFADLQQRFGVQSSLLPSNSEAAPGQRTTYALTLTNTGNGVDNATITLADVPAGWSVVLADPVLKLPPLGTNRTTLNVTAPPGAAAGAKALIRVEVTSQGSNSPTGAPLEKAHPVTAELLVLSRPNPDMTLDGAPRRFVDPGAGTDYVITVRNLGNVAGNFTIVPDNPDPAWAVTATPGHLVLAPLESGTSVVRLRAPGDATVGETLRVITTVQAANAQGQTDQETLVGVVSGPDLGVRGVLLNSTTPYSGDPLALDVVLVNEGNKAPGKNVTLRVSFIQGGVERVIAERDYAGNDLPGARRLVERFVWDTSGVEGPGVLVARIDPSDAVREIDDSPQSNEASVALTMRTFDVTITPPQGLSGRPGEKLTYGERPHVFVLRHRGNSPTEPVRVEIESENGWVDPTKAVLNLELPRGAEVPIPIEVLIPFRPGAATDALRVTVVPDLRPGSPLSASATTRVLDDEKPVITGVLATPAKVKVGQNLTLEATVRDATGVSSVKAHVVSPTNETTVLPMAHVGGDRWALVQTFNVAGAYRFFVEAVDRAEPANGDTTGASLVDFFVDPGSAPLVLLADDQPTTLRAGTPVRLNITDPLGVARAAYVIRGITYDMPRPYQIDTSSFQPGAVDVAVEAENVYGVKSVARFTLTIDNTPPGIRSVKLDPESPKVNQDAVLTIETDSEVEGVDVRIRKDGQVVETRSAERKGPGLFELLLNPGEGDYALDVTAKDAAGNVKLQEGAVSFSAKPKSPFDVPGPGLLLAALALAAAALAARRR